MGKKKAPPPIEALEDSMTIMGRIYTADEVREMDAGSFAHTQARANMTDNSAIREWVKSARGEQPVMEEENPDSPEDDAEAALAVDPE